MSVESFKDLRSAYLRSEVVAVSDLPNGACVVLVRTALNEVIRATLVHGTASVRELPAGTHAIEARSSGGDLLAEEFFSVREIQGEDPIMGFATSFSHSQRTSVVAWLQRLRCTVVQIYDWMANYSEPLATTEAYEDPLGRPIERSALQTLVRALRDDGAVAQAYAPVIAADHKLATEHPEWCLYRTDGAPESLGDLLQIMDPNNLGWQSHWIARYGAAADSLGFNGFHLDTYGYPRVAQTSSSALASMGEGYANFVSAVRQARPNDVLSFNQVNGVPRGFAAPPSPSFRYVEVWAPNSQWRHLEGLVQRSAGLRPPHGDTLALYPPVWGEDREKALRTAVLSEAIATSLGVNVLIWGDDHGVLCHPYYVNYEHLHTDEVDTVLTWHRFGLRCRDLFKRATDTSWYELNDENAAITVTSNVPTCPEPVGGSLFVRVRQSDCLIVLSMIDLSGSEDGSWSSGTGAGRASLVDVKILVDSPHQWFADIATLGVNDGRFEPIELHLTTLREGVGVGCSLAVNGGWSVLRLSRRSR